MVLVDLKKYENIPGTYSCQHRVIAEANCDRNTEEQIWQEVKKKKKPNKRRLPEAEGSMTKAGGGQIDLMSQRWTTEYISLQVMSHL